MDSFRMGEVLVASGVWLFLAELLAHLMFLPLAFHIGPVGASRAITAAALPGLVQPRRDVTLSLSYRVLPGGTCLFRSQWPRGFRSPFRMVGVARLVNGSFHLAARYVLGPAVALLGFLIVMLDATLGFLHQGETFNASLALLLGAALFAGYPLLQYGRERQRFLGLFEELIADLAHPAVEGQAHQ